MFGSFKGLSRANYTLLATMSTIITLSNHLCSTIVMETLLTRPSDLNIIRDGSSYFSWSLLLSSLILSSSINWSILVLLFCRLLTWFSTFLLRQLKNDLSLSETLVFFKFYNLVTRSWRTESYSKFSIITEMNRFKSINYPTISNEIK